jgi:hypothetical protein
VPLAFLLQATHLTLRSTGPSLSRRHEPSRWLLYVAIVFGRGQVTWFCLARASANQARLSFFSGRGVQRPKHDKRRICFLRPGARLGCSAAGHGRASQSINPDPAGLACSVYTCLLTLIPLQAPLLTSETDSVMGHHRSSSSRPMLRFILSWLVKLFNLPSLILTACFWYSRVLTTGSSSTLSGSFSRVAQGTGTWSPL